MCRNQVSAQNAQDATATRPTAPDFLTDVRPLLSNSCFRCHGPDEETRAANLRLDQEDTLFSERNGLHIVVPGNAERSELIRRILTDDPEQQMPPADSKISLTTEQRQLLVDWVNSGATWKPHWAFVAPVRPDVPPLHSVQNALPGSLRSTGSPEPDRGAAEVPSLNEIDMFVLKRLQQQGLSLSSPADPYTIVRRLYLDLIGIPPAPDEADAWIERIWGIKSPGITLKDPSALQTVASEEKYGELVDHLLSRFEYGERWARRWMDLARYADTNGYEKDRDRSIWPWRDWVVGALNADMPFDRFTIEQIAGDLLPNSGDSQKIATGFHRNTMLNEEGGIDPLEFRFYAMTDRVATTGTTWLGLTLGCAQCHTHKYDPVSHREYYQFMALMNNADEPSMELRGADYEAQWAASRQRADEILRQLPSKWPVSEPEIVNTPTMRLSAESVRELQKTLVTRSFEQWLQQQQLRTVAWKSLHPVSASSNLPHLTIEADDSIFVSGDTTKQDEYRLEFAPADRAITALRLEVIPDERLPGHGPGLTWYEGTPGDFYLTEMNVRSGDQSIPFRSATESYARNQYGNNPVSAQLTLDGDIQTGWSVFNGQGERHTAVFVPVSPIPAGQPLSVQMNFGRHFASSLGRFRFSATTDSFKAGNEPIARRLPEEAEQLLKSPLALLPENEKQLLFEQFLLTVPHFEKEAAEILSLRRRPQTTTTLVMKERPPENARPSWRYHRGEYLQPKEQVQPATLSLFPAWPPSAAGNRLDLARWLVDRRNPLTARVTVNRHWAAFFGRGIVSTLDDFGLQGSAPSNQELLDWLAVTFMEEDLWSVKRLHRRIVTSAVYRQNAAVRSEAHIKDPENILLAFAPRFRLDAEMIRDSILHGSGLLSPKAGGPPVRPLQPAGITEVAFGSPGWKVSEGEDKYRRSLYTLIKRTAPFAMITAFDGPSGEACVARRTRSNNPLQALTLLNDVMFLDIAREVGKQIANPENQKPLSADQPSDVGVADDKRHASRLFRRMLTRPPHEDELEEIVLFAKNQRERFRQDLQSALQLMQIDKASIDTSSIPAVQNEQVVEQAVRTALARALFGLDEVQMRP